MVHGSQKKGKKSPKTALVKGQKAHSDLLVREKVLL
jgi:hypothetical protein